MPRIAVALEAESEWMAAREVQQRFMGHAGAGNGALDHSARCRQAGDLGGDCYDFVPLPDDRLAVMVADASGKGLAAALMVSNVQSSLRTATRFAGDQPVAAIDAVNDQVYGSSLADRYATVFYGVFDVRSRTLRYVNAGHHPPMILRRDGSVQWLETGGAPVGMFPDWSYRDDSVGLNPGDVVLAYTDGVVEAVNENGEEWGIDGVRKAAAESGARSAEDLVDAIFRAFDEFSRGCQGDDATVVALRVQ